MKEPIEFVRVPQTGDLIGAAQGPFDPTTTAKLSMEACKQCWSFDRFSPDASGWVHVNAGVDPYVTAETVREGTRFLLPFVRVADWPTSEREVTALAARLIVGVLDDRRFPNGAEIKLYTPFVIRSGDSTWFKRQLQLVLDAYQDLDRFRDRDLKLQHISAGRTVEISAY